MSETTQAEATTAPVVRIERGHPDAEEIAALTVVLLSATGGEGETVRAQNRGWTRRSRSFNAGAVRGAGWGAGF